MGYCCRIFTPVQPVYPAASVRDFLSGAYIRVSPMLYATWDDPKLLATEDAANL
jgi:hypothetical protein